MAGVAAHHCERCGTTLTSSDRCPSCRHWVRWPPAAVFLGAAAIAVVVRAFQGTTSVGILAAAVATGSFAALGWAVIQGVEPTPMRPGRGKETWLWDGLVTLLLTDACVALAVHPQPTDDQVGPLLMLFTEFVGLPGFIALVVAVGRRTPVLANVGAAGLGRCRACSAVLPGRSRYCPECGARQRSE
jgi:hypothetical protein